MSLLLLLRPRLVDEVAPTPSGGYGADDDFVPVWMKEEDELIAMLFLALWSDDAPSA